jgi:hypothetical protein
MYRFIAMPQKSHNNLITKIKHKIKTNSQKIKGLKVSVFHDDGMSKAVSGRA